MEKNERILFQDIPIKGKYQSFHSAILTTFSIDLIDLESHLRNELHRKKICSINVFADQGQIDSSLQYVSPSSLPHIGSDYTVTNIRSHSAFHPKINFFVGYNSVLALIGSGNLTVTGHGKNHEVFTGFMIDDKDSSQQPIIAELWHYLSSIVSKTGEYEKQRILQEIPDNCECLDYEYDGQPHSWHVINEDLSAALLYNEDLSSIMAQIASLIPVEKVQKITISSPFFDEDGRTLLNLTSLCPNAKLDVLIQHFCTLPPINMTPQPSIRFYDFDETKRGNVKIKDYERLAHAKILHFATNDTEYIVVGSANATTAGLGTMNKRGCNDELCVIYSSKKTHFLKELWITPNKHCVINSADFSKRIQHKQDYKAAKAAYVITNACYSNGTLKVYLDKPYENHGKIFVTLNNGIQPLRVESFDIERNVLVINTQLPKFSLSCHLEYHSDLDGDTKCSNTIFVNRIDELNATNPSRLSRELHSFISNIETDGYNGLEVVDMLSSVMHGLLDDICSIQHLPKSGENAHARNTETLPNIEYKAEYDNDDEPTSYLYKKHGVSRLIVSIEESIKRKLNAMEEELNDEEEEANAETSNARTFDTDYSISITKKDIDKYCDQAYSVLKMYKRFVSRRSDICRVNGGNLDDDDLSFFALSMFASMEICYLNRFLYDFDSTNSMERSLYQKLLFEKFDNIMGNEGIEALTTFAKFCNCFHDKKKTANHELLKNGQRALKYALLFATFFSRHAIHHKYKEKYVNTAIRTLIQVFNLPGKEDLSADLQPLTERYNEIIKIKYVEDTLKQMNIEW